MADTKKGLGHFSGRKDSNFLVIKDGETKVIRFLEEGDAVTVVSLHYLTIPNHEGNVVCLGKGCPLCANASEKWNAPISKAGEVFFTKVIERGSDGQDVAKIFRGTRGVAGMLAADFATNKSITGVDYSFSRVLENKKTRYKLSAIHSTFKKLDPQEIAMGAKIDGIDKVVDAFRMTKEEMTAMVDGYLHQDSSGKSETVPERVVETKKKEEVEEDLPF